MSDGPVKPPKPAVVHEAHEVDTFHVPQAFHDKHPTGTHLKDLDEYKKLYDESIRSPDTFWARMARELLTFDKDFQTTHHGSFENGDNAWFVEGRLNASFNCVDRHALKNPDKVAIIYEADEPNEGRQITYGELMREVSRVAWTLKERGVKKGDTVGIYLPMIPEAVIAFLACSRIGAVHSVVFAGFSSDSLRDRVLDASTKVVITSDEGKRGGKVIGTKKIVDEAMKQCPPTFPLNTIHKSSTSHLWKNNNKKNHTMTSSPIPSSSQPFLENEQQPTTPTKNSKKLALIPLIFIIFFEVSGGPYGAEAAIGAAGPFLAILGFLIFPFIWSVPEALVTAELATTFPGNGGFVIWADKAFGPFWGSLMGSWKLLSAICNLASYPVLCLDYVKLVFPVLGSGFPRYIAIFLITMLLSFLNYLGLSIVGYTAVVLGVLSLCPFWLITLFSVPRIDVSRWLSLGQMGVEKDWNLFFNTLFWNLNFWDNASTLAGEVEQPQKTFPKALFSAGIVTCLSYVLPILGTTGAVPLVQSEWTGGYFANLAAMIAGNWLKYWMEVGIVLSVIGLYEAQLSSCAYQILGMAEMGLLPGLFGVRSEWFNTPWVGILVPTLVALVVSYMTFTDIVSSVNFLYSLGMLLEFASFLWLRRTMPDAKRPYQVPLSMPGLVVMCFIPSCFLVYIMVVAHRTVYIVSALLTVFAIAWYFFMEFCKTKMWFGFESVDQDKVDDEIF